MTNQAYFAEIRNLVANFCAAFDNIVINRYDANQVAQSQLQARYVYAPKQRVLYDLVNKAGNITLPVISVWMTNFTRDNSRVFNKIRGFDFGDSNELDFTTHVGSPVPVNITVNMSIMTKYQCDMDQILSNWVPYSNPYIILSWKVPSKFNLNYNYEIRSEVLWDGSISLEYPTDLASTDKYKAIANTSFVIKGWLFPAAPISKYSNIYYISAFHHVESILTEYESMSASTLVYPVSTGLVHEIETAVVNNQGINAGRGYSQDYAMMDEYGNTLTDEFSATITIPGSGSGLEGNYII